MGEWGARLTHHIGGAGPGAGKRKQIGGMVAVKKEPVPCSECGEDLRLANESWRTMSKSCKCKGRQAHVECVEKKTLKRGQELHCSNCE